MKKKYKEPSKVKQSIIQYCVVGLICMPILIGLAFWFSYLKMASWLCILIYGAVILFAWFIWVLIRNGLERRAERIRQMRKENKERMENALKKEKQREQAETRNNKNNNRNKNNILVMGQSVIINKNVDDFQEQMILKEENENQKLNFPIQNKTHEKELMQTQKDEEQVVNQEVEEQVINQEVEEQVVNQEVRDQEKTEITKKTESTKKIKTQKIKK